MTPPRRSCCSRITFAVVLVDGHCPVLEPSCRACSDAFAVQVLPDDLHQLGRAALDVRLHHADVLASLHRADALEGAAEEERQRLLGARPLEGEVDGAELLLELLEERDLLRGEHDEEHAAAASRAGTARRSGGTPRSSAAPGTARGPSSSSHTGVKRIGWSANFPEVPGPAFLPYARIVVPLGPLFKPRFRVAGLDAEAPFPDAPVAMARVPCPRGSSRPTCSSASSPTRRVKRPLGRRRRGRGRRGGQGRPRSC